MNKVPLQVDILKLEKMVNQARYAEALPIALAMTKNFPEHAVGWKVVGILLKIEGRTGDAVIAMRKSVSLDPRDAATQSNLGVTLGELGKYDEAEYHLREALLIDGEFVAAHSNLGKIFKDQGRLLEAEECYRKALSINPEFIEALNNLGVVLYDRDKFKDAEISFDRALKLQPDYIDALNNKANAIRAQGRYLEAIDVYRRVLAINPKYSYSYNNIGVAYLNVGDVCKAIEAYQESIKIRPQEVSVIRNLGDAFRFCMNNTRSLNVYGEALKIAPSSVEGWISAVYMAVLFYLAGNIKQSRLMLNISKPILATKDKQYRSSRSYWLLLDSLLSILNSSANSFEQAEGDSIIYVIGESHSLCAHGVWVDRGGKKMRCEARWIEGCKAWHLGNDSANKYKAAFEQVMSMLPYGSNVLMMVGEIDCRPDEGMIVAAKKIPSKKLSEIARETAEKYIAYLACNSKLNGHKIIVSGIPASYLPESTFSVELAMQHNEIIQKFNACLKKYVLQANLEFLDLYALTNRGDGRSDGSWHIDEIHLRPDAISQAFPSHLFGNDAGTRRRCVRVPSDAEVDLLAELFNQKKNQECEAMAREVIRSYPDHGFGWKVLGAVLSRQGQMSEAVVAKQRASELSPKDADAHFNLGNSLSELRRFAEAESAYRQALVLRPDAPAIHNFLGACLKELGRTTEAESCYRQAIALQPDYAEAYSNLGAVLKQAGSIQHAEASYRRALELTPDFPEALIGYASLKLQQGDPAVALASVLKLLENGMSPDSQLLFVESIKKLRFSQVPDSLRHLLVRSLGESWGRPADLAGVAINMLKLNTAVHDCIERASKAWPRILEKEEVFGRTGLAPLLGDGLMCALLEATQCTDSELEKLLTNARNALLETALTEATDNSVPSDDIKFYSALAQQCFINEYVFAVSENETKKARGLRDALNVALKENAKFSVLTLLAVAAYFPLHTLPQARQLLSIQWPEVMARLIQLQVSEPLEELELRTAIPELTAIEDEISVRVRNLYEENPYPRWIRTPSTERKFEINEFLIQSFPLSKFKPLNESTMPDILIAGCGTGQHAIATARRFKGAQVLAVDLSIASLSYAKRKAQDLGLLSIEFAQADLLELGAIGRRFDIIESVGVLHHLADPLSGWRTLLSLLRPGGLMLLGFYSEIARQDIVRTREFIAQQGYDSTPEDIRRFRQHVISSESVEYQSLKHIGDFYSVSTCRDLIFHVQEHQTTLDTIQTFLWENGLQFLGFEVDAQVLNAYRNRFPNDMAGINLSQWHQFELDNPEAFLGMYQIWVQLKETS